MKITLQYVVRDQALTGSGAGIFKIMSGLMPDARCMCAAIQNTGRGIKSSSKQ
jgi:hypothetical protein